MQRFMEFLTFGEEKKNTYKMNILHDIRIFELEYVLRKLNLEKEKKILDFGAGDGFLVDKFQELGYSDTLGLEIFDSNYSFSKKIITYDGNLSSFPLEQHFDVIFSSNVLEHVQNIEEYLIYFNEKLISNGFQIHIVPTHYWKFYNSLFYYYSVFKFIFSKRFFKKKSDFQSVYKNRINNNLRQNPLFIGRHGSRGSTFDEFVLFNPKEYRKILYGNNFDFYDFKIPLIYSGHYFFGSSLSLKFRKKLSKYFGYSCHCFVIKKVIN
jgi:hypothetical protein